MKLPPLPVEEEEEEEEVVEVEESFLACSRAWSL